MIERGEVYRHIKNLKVFSKEIQKQNPSKQVLPKVDSFLTACLVLTFALVVGLGLGHFLGEHHFFYHFISLRRVKMKKSLVANKC